VNLDVFVARCQCCEARRDLFAISVQAPGKFPAGDHRIIESYLAIESTSDFMQEGKRRKRRDSSVDRCIRRTTALRNALLRRLIAFAQLSRILLRRRNPSLAGGDLNARSARSPARKIAFQRSSGRILSLSRVVMDQCEGCLGL